MISGKAYAMWYSSNWSYRQMGTIDSSKVPGDLTDFPVLVKIKDADLKVSPGGNVGKANGGDILFTAADGITKLDHEIESYNSATGRLTAWVEVLFVSSTSDTVIYMYYGNAGAADQWNMNGTWNNNYVGVWHLKEDPSGAAPQMKDSTSNSNDGTSNGGMTSGDQVAGQINGSLDFDGFNDYVNAGNNASLQISDFTVTGWINPDSIARFDTIISKMMLGTPWRGWVIFEDSSTNNRLTLAVRDPWSAVSSNNNFLSTGNWIHFAVVKSGLSVNFYRNGASFGSGTLINDTSDVISQDLVIGRFYFNYNNFYFDGTIDEVRISNTSRSDDWIEASYNNQSDPSSFLSFGAPAVFTPVPTMTEWGMILFMVLAGLGSIYYLRRKKIQS